MNKNLILSNPAETGMVLDCKTVPCERSLLHYSFLVRRRGERTEFFATVCGFGEQEEASLGLELFDAVKAYERLVQGLVPPSVLEEVSAEYFCAKQA